MIPRTTATPAAAPTPGTAITYICLPEGTYQAMQADIAEMKRYMLRNPQKNAGKELPKYVSPKELEGISGFSHSALARHIKDAQATGVQVIGLPGKHRVHLQQFPKTCKRR